MLHLLYTNRCVMKCVIFIIIYNSRLLQNQIFMLCLFVYAAFAAMNTVGRLGNPKQI